jgi:hypothetical protein
MSLCPGAVVIATSGIESFAFIPTSPLACHHVAASRLDLITHAVSAITGFSWLENTVPTLSAVHASSVDAGAIWN